MNLDVMFSSEDMTWSTPQRFFDHLNNEFDFELDPCCVPETAKCKKYFTPETDGLKQDWGGSRVFMNPPYGRDLPIWIKKAHKESLNGATVVCLIPARPDTKIWHETIFPYAEIRFIKGRLKFGDGKNSAPFPSCVVIFGKEAEMGVIKTIEDWEN